MKDVGLGRPVTAAAVPCHDRQNRGDGGYCDNLRGKWKAGGTGFCDRCEGREGGGGRPEGQGVQCECGRGRRPPCRLTTGRGLTRGSSTTSFTSGFPRSSEP